MLRFISSHKVKIAVYTILMTILAIAVFVVYQGRNLASPSRRALQDYHRVILDNPQNHGITITAIDCRDGQAPALIVEPSLPDHLGVRGKMLRSQLDEKGVSYNKLGVVIKTAVLLHGRNGRKEDLLPVAERFCAVGIRCILIDLPAHGESSRDAVKFGADDWEQDLPRMVLLECAQQHGFSPDGAALWGMSMGGSFANSAIADPVHGDTWSSLTIVCSFDRLASVLENKSHSAFLSQCVSKVCQSNGGADIDAVTPALWVTDSRLPVLVVHGVDDDLIPMENGRDLFDSYGSNKKRWIEVPSGNHNNILITPMPLYAEMAEWILSHPEVTTFP